MFLFSRSLVISLLYIQIFVIILEENLLVIIKSTIRMISITALWHLTQLNETTVSLGTLTDTHCWKLDIGKKSPMVCVTPHIAWLSTCDFYHRFHGGDMFMIPWMPAYGCSWRFDALDASLWMFMDIWCFVFLMFDEGLDAYCHMIYWCCSSFMHHRYFLLSALMIWVPSLLWRVYDAFSLERSSIFGVIHDLRHVVDEFPWSALVFMHN